MKLPAKHKCVAALYKISQSAGILVTYQYMSRQVCRILISSSLIPFQDNCTSASFHSQSWHLVVVDHCGLIGSACFQSQYTIISCQFCHLAVVDHCGCLLHVVGGGVTLNNLLLSPLDPPLEAPANKSFLPKSLYTFFSQLHQSVTKLLLTLLKGHSLQLWKQERVRGQL